MVTRKGFVGGGAALFGAAFLPTAACAAEGDWKSAFRSVGFDPDAPDASWFAVTSDIHADKQHISLAEHVATWNAMEPRPAFVAALGDMGQVNGCFGHRPSPQVAAENAERQFGAINAVLSQGLRKDIPRVYVVGNHDTYIGEDDRALWRTHFPDQPPYCAFDACGLRFVKWDGGVDGMIDAEQEKWIRNECATCPKDVQLVVLVHQPSVGSCGMERDIGRVAKAALAGRPGVTWLLGGHEHHNAFARWDLPGGGTLAVATHTMDRHGWWAYGVKAGRIVARLFKSNASHSFSCEKMPEAYASKGEIPLAWQGRNDVVWHAFVGSPEEKACRVSLVKTGDNCGWLFYVGTTLYRFPKGKVAPTATRYAILGRLCGERKTKRPARCFLSADGENWAETTRSVVAHDVNEFPIPPELVGAETLWVRYEGFGYGADECHAAFAFLSPGRFEMTVINPEVVSGGCGLCVIMRTPAGRTYLFDTANGMGGAVKNNGKDIIIPWLEKRGITKIDGLILSHYHSDHFGGLLYLADHFEIGHIFDNSFEPLNAYGNGEVDSAKRCLFNWEKKHPGQVTRYLVEGDDLGWNEPGVKFDVVWPPKTGYCKPLDRGPDYKRNGSLHHLLNANSTGLRIRVGKVDYLILGDINADYVAEYMRPYMERKGTWTANVVVLHCHGIADDKGANVAAMKPLPEVSIASLGNLKWMFSAGRNSVATYSKMGIQAFSTNLHGDISVSTDGRTLDVATDPTKLYPETKV